MSLAGWCDLAGCQSSSPLIRAFNVTMDLAGGAGAQSCSLTRRHQWKIDERNSCKYGWRRLVGKLDCVRAVKKPSTHHRQQVDFSISMLFAWNSFVLLIGWRRTADLGPYSQLGLRFCNIFPHENCSETAPKTAPKTALKTALELLWNCFKIALKLLWNCSEIAFKLFWKLLDNCSENCSRTALKLL